MASIPQTFLVSCAGCSIQQIDTIVDLPRVPVPSAGTREHVCYSQSSPIALRLKRYSHTGHKKEAPKAARTGRSAV
jgi:hypothetical protein